MDELTDSKNKISELEKNLYFLKVLQDVTNRIYDANNIKLKLFDLKDDILNLFSALAFTIYEVNGIFSIFLDGVQLSEIFVPISNNSIAGYVAKKKKIVNIADAYDKEELKNIDKELSFDISWDKKYGFKTIQFLAAPILYGETLMGVIEILNKKGGETGKFSKREESLLQEISQVLGLAFYNRKGYAWRRKTRFDHLVKLGLLKKEELESAFEEARVRRETIEAYLMKKYKISKADIGTGFEKFYHFKFIEFNDKYPIPRDLPVLKNFKKEYLRRELWVPIEKVDEKIHVIIDNPNNILKRETIESLLKTHAITYSVAMADDIIKYINYFFPEPKNEPAISESDILGILGQMDKEEEEDIPNVSDGVIIQLANKIINDAFDRRASAIHIEPYVTKKNVEVRFRIDGDCVLYQTLPYRYQSALVARIKILSGLDITVRRIPQTGRIKHLRYDAKHIEIRVVTIPSHRGAEDLVLHLQTKEENLFYLPIEAIGMSTRNFKSLTTICKKPDGIILISGPARSGKTTTIYAALEHINTPNKKIWTVDNYVDIEQHSLRQVQVDPNIGYDYATAMRTFLNADADVIMVGEIANTDTATMMLKAAISGNLVIGAIHARETKGTIEQIIDWGLDPLLLSKFLHGILSQRLIKTLCRECKEGYHPSREEYERAAALYGPEAFAKMNIPYCKDITFYRPKGCDSCLSGYNGRTGIHELLICSDQIRQMIKKNASADIIKEKAVEQGMTTLLQDGIIKVFQGITDMEQVLLVLA